MLQHAYFRNMMKMPKYAIISSLLLILLLPGCTIEEDDPSLTDVRDKFTGTWKFNETELKNTMAFYNVLIIKDVTNSSRVLLKNFGNLGNFQQAYGIVTSGHITVATQNVGTVTVSGTGTLSGSTRMNWTYSINDAADLKNYTAIATKQ